MGLWYNPQAQAGIYADRVPERFPAFFLVGRKRLI
jgi:hypothetical protein